MLKFSLIASSMGFVLALIAHIVALIGAFFGYGSSIVSNMIIAMGILVAIIFISLIPLLIEGPLSNDGFTERIKEEDKLWLYGLSLAMPVYCIGMFFLSSILNKHGSPEIFNGQYILAYKGELIEVLTKSEYIKQMFYSFIGGTSIVIAFYCVILIEVYLRMKDKVIDEYL